MCLNFFSYDGWSGVYTILGFSRPDVTALLNAIASQKQRARLFQLLNGVDEIYAPQRSHFIMMSQLPTVEAACATLQQEESQKDVIPPSSGS